MKSPDEIRATLAELKSDDRLTYESATIQINAPLALHQLASSSKIHALEWVLGLPLSKFPLKKKKQ